MVRAAHGLAGRWRVFTFMTVLASTATQTAQPPDFSQVEDLKSPGWLTGSDDHGIYKNWEDSVECRPQEIAFPTSVDEVVRLVKTHDHIRAIGPAASFNRFICSEGLILSLDHMNKVYLLDTEHAVVVTEPGIHTRELVAWLAQRGWTLPTHPFYVDQSIAGGAAAGAHGSCTEWGTMASLIKALKIVTADGSVLHLTEKDGFLFHAARQAWGYLGVVVELTVAIVPDKVVYRDTKIIGAEDLLRDIALFARDPMKVNQVNYWYFPYSKYAIRTSNQPTWRKTADVNPGKLLSWAFYTFISGTTLEKLYWDISLPLLHMENMSLNNAWVALWQYIMSCYPGHYHLSEVLPIQQHVTTEVLNRAYGKYDQIEFAVPAAKAVHCMAAFLDTIERTDWPVNFKVPHLFRYVKEDPWAPLGLTNDGPRLYFNLDNYDVYHKGGYSPAMEEVKKLMATPVCDARMHFGKAGIHAPAPGGAWTKADAVYVKSTFRPDDKFGGKSGWEAFAELAIKMDPTGKFHEQDRIMFDW